MTDSLNSDAECPPKCFAHGGSSTMKKASTANSTPPSPAVLPKRCSSVPPSAAGETGTLVNRLLYHFPELAGVGGFGPLQPGLLNRLDWATSGIVLAARNDAAWERVRAEFAGHRVRKEYLGLVDGILEESLIVDRSLIHDQNNPARVRHSVHPHSDPTGTWLGSWQHS